MPFNFSGPSDKEIEERKLRNAEQRKKMGQPESFRKEPGIEELDLEEAIPGGAYLSMANPLGLGKKGFQLGGKAAFRAGKELMEEAEEAMIKKVPKNLEKMMEKGAPKTINYAEEEAKRLARREAAEAAAPTMDYATDAMKKTKDELASEAKRKKIKPTSFRYEGGNPIEE